MNMRSKLLAVLLGGWLAAAGLAAGGVEKAASAEVTIPFANHGGVSDWRVVDDTTLLIKDVHGHWYRAKLLTAATELHFTDSVGFDTSPSGSLGKHSSIVVEGRRYPIVSLTRTERPAKP